MASLLPKFCLVLDKTVLDRIAFLIDNAQIVSSDLRVLKTYAVYMLFSCFSLKLVCPRTLYMNIAMDFPVNYTACYARDFFVPYQPLNLFLPQQTGV